MKIKTIEIFHVVMPLISPWTTAYGSDESIETLIVKISSDGISGWGEATPLKYPIFCSEWTKGAFMVASEVIAPKLIGENIESGTELGERLAWIKGNQYAKAAFDLAWWDLHAKMQNKPLWKIIGGKSPEVEAGTAFGIEDSLDALLGKIDVAVKAGFKRIKLKYSRNWGFEIMQTVRSHFPKATFHIDCNSSFTLDDLPMFKKLDELELAMIEQPLAYDDLVHHAELQRQIGTPICLDESITSPDKAGKAIQLGACRWINIKLGRCGGISNSLEICRIAADAGIPCWVGSMLESALGQTHSLNLATLENMKYPNSISPSTKYYRKDVCIPGMKPISTGKFRTSEKSGVGIEPDSDMLDLYTRQKCRFDKNKGAKK